MTADRVIFACAIVLAAVYFYATAQIPSLEIGDPLGPTAFPRLLGVGLLITAGFLLVEILRAGKAENKTEAKSPAADRHHYWVVAAVAVWTGAYFAVFEWLGYVISTTIYLIGLTAYFNPGKWIANVLTSVLFCVGSYVMFSKLLGVTLAVGILPF